MKIDCKRWIPTITKYFIIIIALNNNKNLTLLNAEEPYLRDIEIDTSTKLNEDSTALPTNPFEIIEMLRRANSMNDATKPSDAIDDALNSFNMVEDK